LKEKEKNAVPEEIQKLIQKRMKKTYYTHINLNLEAAILYWNSYFCRKPGH
jgi:hypothetical protein